MCPETMTAICDRHETNKTLIKAKDLHYVRCNAFKVSNFIERGVFAYQSLYIERESFLQSLEQRGRSMQTTLSRVAATSSLYSREQRVYRRATRNFLFVILSPKPYIELPYPVVTSFKNNLIAEAPAASYNSCSTVKSDCTTHCSKSGREIICVGSIVLLRKGPTSTLVSTY